MATANFLARVKSKLPYTPKPTTPVLDKDDEVFLDRIVSEPARDGEPVPPPVEVQGGDTPTASVVTGQSTPASVNAENETAKAPEATPKTEPKPAGERIMAFIRQKTQKKPKEKPTDGKEAAVSEEDREEKGIEDVLDKLDLAAADNRVFARNKEMQVLLQDFKQIFKDLVNGVPTAYDDLESLFKNRDKQLQSLYDSLPLFIRKLIKQLPDKMAPEVLATLAAKADASGVNLHNAGKAAAAAGKGAFGRDMFTKPAALAGLLRSIVTFLRARFPALMGMSVLWSLALCILLLVLWYCHKRGREVRLDKEKSESEGVKNSESDLPTVSATGESSKDPAPAAPGSENSPTAEPTAAPPAETSPSQPAPAGKGDSALHT